MMISVHTSVGTYTAASCHRMRFLIIQVANHFTKHETFGVLKTHFFLFYPTCTRYSLAR